MEIHPPEGYVSAHNNGLRTDCRLVNLRWDTQKNNIADKYKHGTAQVGERSPNSKLTNEQASDILTLWKQGGHTQVELAKMFGVSAPCVNSLILGRNWKILHTSNTNAPEVLIENVREGD